MQQISYRAALRKIILAGGDIMGITFVKADGELRDMTFRRNVATMVKNNPDNAKNDSTKRVRRGSLITVVEMDGTQDRKWKTINLRTVTELRVNKERYVIDESTVR
jgi:hypothetical protein